MNRQQRGFTLLEVMITIAIVGILTAIALPSYTQHVMRTRLTEGFSALATAEVAMRNHWNNSSPRSYADIRRDRLPPDSRYFTYAVSNDTQETFTITATGQANTSVEGFAYSIDHTGARLTTSVPPGGEWTTGDNCWVDRKGGLCSK